MLGLKLIHASKRGPKGPTDCNWILGKIMVNYLFCVIFVMILLSYSVLRSPDATHRPNSLSGSWPLSCHKCLLWSIIHTCWGYVALGEVPREGVWEDRVTIFVSNSQIARFMGPKWGPPWGDRTQVGPMLAPWTLLSVNLAIRDWLSPGWCKLVNTYQLAQDFYQDGQSEVQSPKSRIHNTVIFL